MTKKVKFVGSPMLRTYKPRMVKWYEAWLSAEYAGSVTPDEWYEAMVAMMSERGPA